MKNIKIACAPYGEGHGPIGSNIYCFFIETVCRRSISRDLLLGAVHKLRLQEEGGRWSKKSTFCKLLYHRKCKRRGVGGQKKTNLVNVVCERPLSKLPVKPNFP